MRSTIVAVTATLMQTVYTVGAGNAQDFNRQAAHAMCVAKNLAEKGHDTAVDQYGSDVLVLTFAGREILMWEPNRQVGAYQYRFFSDVGEATRSEVIAEMLRCSLPVLPRQPDKGGPSDNGASGKGKPSCSNSGPCS